MIATLSEIKTLLGISGTTQDAKIKLNMPIVENFICSFCKNDFVEYAHTTPSYPRVCIQSNELEFTNNTNSLDSTTLDFTDYRIAAGDNLRVYGSFHNEKVFTISSITANSIVFEDVNTVKDENYSDYLTVVRVIYPEDLKKAYAFMINYNIKADSYKGLQSETILGYSYTLSPNNKTSYPDSVISELYNYRKMLKRPLFNSNTAGVLYYGD